MSRTTGGFTLTSTTSTTDLSYAEAQSIAVLISTRDPRIDPLDALKEIWAARDTQAVLNFTDHITGLLKAIEAEQGEAE